MLSVKQNNSYLITAAKLGNKTAFNQLIEADYDKLLGFIGSRFTTEPKEDIAQETLIEAYKNFYRFKGHSSFFTWLCSIAKQVIQRTERKRKLHTCQLNEKITWSGKNPYEVIESNELHSYLDKFINSLPPRERESFEFRFIRKKTNALLAKEKGLSPSAVKKAVYRANTKWKSFINQKMLNDYG